MYGDNVVEFFISDLYGIVIRTSMMRSCAHILRRLCTSADITHVSLQSKIYINKLTGPVTFFQLRTKFLDARPPDLEKKEKQLVLKESVGFDEAAKVTKTKNKLTFQKAVQKYADRSDIYRRGHVEFIHAALSKMKEFGVHKDLSVYKQLIDLFPKGKMIPKSMWEVGFETQCSIFVKKKIETKRVTKKKKKILQCVIRKIPEILGENWPC